MQNRDPLLRIMNRCAHFNGVQHGQCEVGVSYDAVREAKAGDRPFRFACFQDEAHGLTCEKAKFPTREEAEAEERADQAAYERLKLALVAARDDAKAHGYAKGHGGAGEIACPVCLSGRLRYSVASYNGHMHGQCSTASCVSWMQ